MRTPTTFWIILLIGLIGLMIVFSLVPSSSANINEIQEFLENDTTDNNKYLSWYTCGHFSRELSYNASLQNITVGSVILGYHPTFRGYQNHIMNYIIINDTVVLIEPQTDQITCLNQTMYSYYRLYPDGTQVPTNWRHNLAPTGHIY